MLIADAPFHELQGIGPATEAKLHQSGLQTWAALAETLDAIARVKGIDAAKLRGLRDEARQKVDYPSTSAGAEGERSSRFVVSAVAGPDGRVARSSVIDVRSQLSQAFAGISGSGIARFIEEQIGVHASGTAVQAAVPDLAALGQAEALDFDPAVPIRFTASSADNDLVVVDAGKAIGGADDDIVLRWDTTEIDAGGRDEFRYRASLAGRPYGGSQPSGWGPLGVLAGSAHPGELIDLAFKPSGLSPGVNRLELAVEVQPLPEKNEGVRRIEARMVSR